jgi:hypothetical protein
MFKHINSDIKQKLILYKKANKSEDKRKILNKMINMTLIDIKKQNKIFNKKYNKSKYVFGKKYKYVNIQKSGKSTKFKLQLICVYDKENDTLFFPSKSDSKKIKIPKELLGFLSFSKKFHKTVLKLPILNNKIFELKKIGGNKKGINLLLSLFLMSYIKKYLSMFTQKIKDTKLILYFMIIK